MSALSKARPQEIRRRLGMDEAARRILLYGVMPTWIGAGVADWWHHRRTRIERTSGTRESAIHSLMMAEAGLPTFLGLFAEINAAVLATATGTVAVREQHGRGRHRHDFRQTVDLLLAGGYVTPGLRVVHTAPDFRLRAKSRPLSATARAAVLGSTALFITLPYAEELVRCARAVRRPTTTDTLATQTSQLRRPSPSMTDEE